MTSNEEIYLSYLCDRIMAVCNRINKKLDVMDEHQSLFTYADSYPPLQYSAPAYVTPWGTTAEPYFHQPLPPPYTHQPTQPPDPPDWQCHSPTNNQPTYTAPPYDHPPLVDAGFHPSPDQLGWQQLYYHQISATSAVDNPFYTTSDVAAPPLHPPLPPTPPRSPSSWWSPGHCRSAATLVAAAPPPSLLSDDNTSTMVLGEDVSDGIVPNNASVGATLDVPNDKVVEEIVKNDGNGSLKASSPRNALECVQIAPDFCENINITAVKAFAIGGPRLRMLGNLFVGEEHKGNIADASEIRALMNLIPRWSQSPDGEGRYQSQRVVFGQMLMRFGVGVYDWTRQSYVFDPGGTIRGFLVSTLWARWISTVGELIRSLFNLSFISCIII